MAPMTRDDWFRVASRQLVEHGEPGLKIAALTRAAGVTQGSYYHHFGGQAGFVRAFLEHLTSRAFGPASILVGDEDTPDGARAALRRLVQAIATEDLELEAAVRRWAHSDPTVAGVVDDIDAHRAALVEGLFLAITGDPASASYLTRLNTAFYLGAVWSRPPIQGDDYARMAGDLERLLDLDEGER